MAIRTWNDIQKEIKGVMLNTVSLVKQSLLTEFYLNMYKTSLKSPCSSNYFKNYSIFTATISNWLLKTWGFICHCQYCLIIFC